MSGDSWTTVVIALLTFVPACGAEELAGPSPADARLVSSEAFAGSDVLAQGDWYRDPDRIFHFRADTFPLATRRVDDSTLALTLPSAANGSLLVTETIGGTPVERGRVEVYGYARTGTVNVPITSYLVPAGLPGFPLVIGGDSGGVSFISPATDAVTRFAGIAVLDQFRFQGLRGAGISYDPSRILLSSTDSVVERWFYLPLPQTIDTARQTRARLIAEIGPGKFLVGVTHEVQLYGYGSATFHIVEDATRTYLSPSGDRATVRGSAPNLPVFDTQTGGIAFTIDGLFIMRDAAFTADGILYVTGWTLSETQLRAYSATDGDSLGLVTTPDEAVSVTADPVRPLVYLASFSTDATVTIRVYRRADLSLAGTMTVKVTDVCRFATVCYGDVAMVETGDSSELVLLLNKGATTDLLHFRLPPVGALASRH